MSKRKSSSNGEQLSRKLQSVSNSNNSAGKKRSSPINISLESDDEIDNANTLPSRSTDITNQSSSAKSKDIPKRNSVPLKKVKQHSWVWKHATLIHVTGQPDKYSCVYCDKKFLRNGTGVISRHLRLKINQQCTLTSSLEVVAPFKFDSEKSHQYFLQFIVADNHPFFLGEEAAFCRFIASLPPLYKPLSRTSVKDKLMSTFIEQRILPRSQGNPDNRLLDLAK